MYDRCRSVLLAEEFERRLKSYYPVFLRVHRYMGTITSISDLDLVNGRVHSGTNLQVEWDESAVGDRPSRVSIWDIESVATPFYICPPHFSDQNFLTILGC